MLVLAGLLMFLAYHLPVRLLLADTLTVGGDTPAHNYLASALKHNLIHGHRIIGWAPGWWCGFPLYQFYFCFPYLLIVLLDVFLPFNVAFKLVSVLGAFALAPAAYVSGRWLRLPRPSPILLAIVATLFLFARSHTMWGVNLFSTLAGMIANSISFPLMLLAMASTWRDMQDDRFRLRTVFLLSALLASHFFTSLVAGIALVLSALGPPGSGVVRRLRRLAGTGALALLLMAWWIVPLLAKQDFSVDFGTNWNISLWRALPPYVYMGVPSAAWAIWQASRGRHPGLVLYLWMLIVALFLFYFGFRISPVFVNVRLWPFICYAAVALGAIGMGLLLSRLRATGLFAAAAAIGVLLYISEHETRQTTEQGAVRDWAEFNYGGLESKPAYPVFRDLVLPLAGTPGRLANDLSPANNALGSSRIFECVPHLIDKPILEGGLVNSAIGSLFSYYVQSETSQNCAGFPPLVTPASFNLSHASLHLRLFNVKHLIARWAGLKESLKQSEDWRLLRTSGEWELYELLTHDGRYVTVPEHAPIAVRTDQWKSSALRWLYHIASIDQPYLFLFDEVTPLPPGVQGALSESHFLARLASPDQEFNVPEKPAAEPILYEEVLPDRIRFTTTAIGRPHIIKCTYFPNWKVRGADRIYLVTPGFMLVYPSRADVELYYGYVPADLIGYALTSAGWMMLAAILILRLTRPSSSKAQP